MALRFSDGFDLYTAASDLNGRDWVLENSGSLISIGTTAGRYGGGALQLGDGSTDYLYNAYFDGGSADNIMCFGFSFKCASTPSGSHFFIGIKDKDDDSDGFNPDTTTFDGLRLGITSSGTVYVGMAGSSFGQIVGYGFTNICDGAWHWIEITFKINGSTGITIVYVDGVAEINEPTTDTVGGGGSTPTRIQNEICISTNSDQTATIYIDDLLIYDDVSSGITGDLTYTSNFPIGDSRIETLQPDGAGNYSQWTPSIAVPNYQCVDEDNENGDTDYVETSTAGNKDTYTFGDLAASPVTIHACHVGIVGKADPGGTTDIKAMARSSSTDYEGASYTLGSGYTFTQTNVAQDPNTTSAWDEAGVNAAEFGYESQA